MTLEFVSSYDERRGRSSRSIDRGVGFASETFNQSKLSATFIATLAIINGLVASFLW